jgi:hypothetical protein
MELPRALAPWGPYLAIFPRDLALSLGPVLQRLSSAVGPLQVRRAHGGGEVDGYDGIDRHGSYERLLSTEWLLADEMPDEFLRRAVMGEHLFLHASRPEPGGIRTSVAIFDAGPGQLGSPRIAQLAALIVLARRAEDAGARFAWGILQTPDAPLHPEVTEAGILRLLQARTPHEATDSQIGAWNTRVRGWKELDDVWMVGPPRLGSLPATRGASILQVWDVLDPEIRRVAIKVRPGAAGMPPRELALDLPEDAVCARLLRDPFAAAASVPRRLEARNRPASNLLFSGNGTKLFARGAGGGVVAYPIPHSPRAEAGEPRVFDPVPGDLPVAVGLADKNIHVATRGEGPEDGVNNGGITLHTFHKRGGHALTLRYNPASPSPQEAGRPSAPLLPLLFAGRRIWLRDSGGTLFQLIHPPGGQALVAPRGTATAAVVAAGALCCVEPATPESPARLARFIGDRPAETLLELPGPGRRAHFGFGGRIGDPQYGVLAVELEQEGTWEIFCKGGDGESTWFLTPFAGTQVVGVGRDGQRSEPGLLLLQDDWRTLVLAGRKWSRKVATAASEIEHVVVQQNAPRFAWSTVSGELAIGSLDQGGTLFRLLPEEGP